MRLSWWMIPTVRVLPDLSGRGTVEHWGLEGEIDVITGTLGKALGGAAGGYVASSRAVVDALIQSSRPQLFSNALPASVAAGALEAIHILKGNPAILARLRENTAALRRGLNIPRVQSAGGRERHHSHHRGENFLRHRNEQAAAGEGDLCHRFRLPGGSRGKGKDTGSGIGGVIRKGYRPGPGCL